jgi:hypothetical protein
LFFVFDGATAATFAAVALAFTGAEHAVYLVNKVSNACQANENDYDFLPHKAACF